MVTEAALQVPLAMVLMFDRGLNQDTIHGFSSLARMLTLVSSGYFLVDGTVVLKNMNEHGAEPLAHAVICITFFCYSALRQQLQYFAPRVIFFEFSTPFVHLRWFLHSLGLQQSKLYKMNGLAMIGSFAVCRVVWGTSALHRYLITGRILLCACVLVTVHLSSLQNFSKPLLRRRTNTGKTHP